ncbi:MAG: PD-(D/E)XK nuclease family protein [Nanoarchaeales archaeon]
MLINDSTTMTYEISVYLLNDDIKYFKKQRIYFFENYRTPITGHIDILQIRNGLIHILDYKPNAEKVNAINQLTIYALALASRTKLAVKDFKCAWFDEKYYFEFFSFTCRFNFILIAFNLVLTTISIKVCI